MSYSILKACSQSDWKFEFSAIPFLGKESLVFKKKWIKIFKNNNLRYIERTYPTIFHLFVWYKICNLIKLAGLYTKVLFGQVC